MMPEHKNRNITPSYGHGQQLPRELEHTSAARKATTAAPKKPASAPRRKLTTSNGVPTTKASASRKTQRQSQGAQVRRQYDNLRAKAERGEISHAEFARRGMEMHKKYFGKS